jgi:bifunctional DNA primase/polymerase-like protein
MPAGATARVIGVMRRAALAYAGRLGWPVLPLKVPAIRGGRGVHDATHDPETIVHWWHEHTGANIGVACGAVSQIVVVDVDGDAGRATLAELQAVHGTLPPTPRQITGSGGLHLFFAYDAAHGLGNSVRRLPGIDTRSNGGYAVVPPSVHPQTSRRYCWDPELHPLRLKAATMPPWLIDLLAPHAKASPFGQVRPAIEEDVGWGPRPLYSRAALQRACEAIETAAVGEQDQTLNREAYSIGRLVGAGLMPRRLAIDCLVYSATMMGNAPGRRRWHEREIQQKVVRAVREGQLHPREVA